MVKKGKQGETNVLCLISCMCLISQDIMSIFAWHFETLIMVALPFANMFIGSNQVHVNGYTFS